MKNLFIETVANGYIVRDADSLRYQYTQGLSTNLDVHVFRNVNELALALPRLLDPNHSVFAKSECKSKS